MESVRIGVIGLGWFGEVHCDAIRATPGLELAGLCTRTEARLADLGRKYGVDVQETDYRALLERDDLDAVSVVTMWDQHTEPTLDAALAAGQACFSGKADGFNCRRLRKKSWRLRKNPPGHLMVGHICRFNPRYARGQGGKSKLDNIGRILSMYARAETSPPQWTAGNSRQDRAHRRRRHPRHRPDALVQRRPQVVSAFAQTVDVRGLRHTPTMGWTMYRFDCRRRRSACSKTVWCHSREAPPSKSTNACRNHRHQRLRSTSKKHFPNFSASATKAGFRIPPTPPTGPSCTAGSRARSARSSSTSPAACRTARRPPSSRPGSRWKRCGPRSRPSARRKAARWCGWIRCDAQRALHESPI